MMNEYKHFKDSLGGRILTNCEQNEIPMNFMNNLLILQSFTQSLHLIYFSLTIIINLYVIINL